MKYLILSCLACVSFILITCQASYVRGNDPTDLLLCPSNSHQACAPCCPDPSCQIRIVFCRADRYCDQRCKSICRCNVGYLKDNVTGKCVLPAQCPKSTIKPTS
uniref:Cysteine-rich venom protein 6-like n=1 Tax=Diabrotica virgifera virgifera TaxID=50390 RepID=A0A6P7FF64_DIAVI